MEESANERCRYLPSQQQPNTIQHDRDTLYFSYEKGTGGISRCRSRRQRSVDRPSVSLLPSLVGWLGDIDTARYTSCHHPQRELARDASNTTRTAGSDQRQQDDQGDLGSHCRQGAATAGAGGEEEKNKGAIERAGFLRRHTHTLRPAVCWRAPEAVVGQGNGGLVFQGRKAACKDGARSMEALRRKSWRR